jgi:ligand-binding sensor domain-containing protein
MRKVCIFAWSFILLIMTSASAVFAQNFWQQTNGPYGGDIRAFAINPTTQHIFAGTLHGGVFRSTNNGDSWTAVNTGFTSTNVQVEALAINASGQIFAGTGGGVFRSTNNGDSWAAVTYTGGVLALAINASGYIFAGTFGGEVFRSTNNGDSWTAVNTGLTNTIVWALAINAGGNIFAGTFGGVFRSTNNGDSWTAVNTGLTDGNVYALAINASGHIFAGTTAGGGVFRSTNNGDSWTAVNTGLANTFVSALALNSSGHIFAGISGGGVFRSTNNGGSWTVVNTGLTNAEVLELAINASGHIFAGTDGGGVFRSTNNGDSWTAVNTGLTSTNVQVQALAINSSGHIFAGTVGGGVFRSTNNGDSWTAVNTGLTNTSVLALAINASGHIFAGTSGGVFRSTNNGDSWTAVNIGLTSTYVQALAINSSGHIFAGTQNGGAFRSTNNGDSWTAINTGLTNTFVRALAINASGHIFAGTLGSGVFRSTNNGDSWTAINAGLTNPYVYALAINASGHIFAGTLGGGVFRSTNNGDSWTAVNAGLTATVVYALAINASGHIFAGTRGGGVFRSVESTTPAITLAVQNLTASPNRPAVGNPVTISGTVIVNGVPGSTQILVEDPISDLPRTIQTQADGTFSFVTNNVPAADTYTFRFFADGQEFASVSVAASATSSAFDYVVPLRSGDFSISALDRFAPANFQTTPFMLANRRGVTDIAVASLRETGRKMLRLMQLFVQENKPDIGYFAGSALACGTTLAVAPPFAPAVCGTLGYLGLKRLPSLAIGGLAAAAKFTVEEFNPPNPEKYYDLIDRGTATINILQIKNNPDGLVSFDGMMDLLSLISTLQDMRARAEAVEINNVTIDANGNVTGFGCLITMKNDEGVLALTVAKPLSRNACYIFTDSPVDIEIVDPNGRRVNKTDWQIPESFYLEADYDGDGEIEDFIDVPDPLPGNYQITVVPESGAPPTATYSLHTVVNGDTTVLAEHVPLQNIPSQPYVVNVNPNLRTYTYAFSQQGWHLASLPAQVTDGTIATLFPKATGAFGWSNNAYYNATQLQPQNGYWLAISEAHTKNITGTPITTFTAHYTPGWHLIGSVADWINFTNPNDTPDGSIIATFNWEAATQSYHPATILEPGQAYWIAIAQECDLTIGGNSSSSVTKVTKAMSWQAFAAKFGATPPLPPSQFTEETLSQVPMEFSLSQNYPNPFWSSATSRFAGNPETVIEYHLPKAGRVSLKIYDLVGREVRTLVDAEKPAGYHRVRWDGKDNAGQKLNSGVYLYRIQVGTFVQTRKVVLVK